MSVPQAALTVLAGNVVILIPLTLIGHAGARYGVPFAVLARASFGVRGCPQSPARWSPLRMQRAGPHRIPASV